MWQSQYGPSCIGTVHDHQHCRHRIALIPVDDKTRAFKASLAATLSSFMLRQEAEILKIPRDLRQMKLGDLEAKWGGSWAGTVQRIARGKIEEREKAEKAERDRRREEEEAKGKRWVFPLRFVLHELQTEGREEIKGYSVGMRLIVENELKRPLRRRLLQAGLTRTVSHSRSYAVHLADSSPARRSSEQAFRSF